MSRKMPRIPGMMVLIACGVAVMLLVCCWHMPAMARAANEASAPVAGQHSCAASSGAHGTAAVVVARGQTSGAQLYLNRVEGPPGTQLALSGDGWPAGAAVTIDLMGQQANGQAFVGVAGIAHVTALGDGSFHTGTFAAPYQHSCVGGGYGDPNTLVRYSAHTVDKSVEAEAQFRYLPAATVQIVTHDGYGQGVKPGAKLTIMGLHWEPEAEVTLTAATVAHAGLPHTGENAPVPVAGGMVRVAADMTGSFQANMRVPVMLPPRTGVVIAATGSGPRYGALTVPGETLVALPVTMPTLTLDRSEGTAGSSVLLAGEHWVAGEVVQLEYCRGELHTFGMTATDLRCDPFTTQGLGEARVGQDGRFRAPVTLPVSARLGVVTIQGRVVNDIFGLMVYAQAQRFTIVPPSVPWTTEHPWLTRVAEVAGGSMLFAAVMALSIWMRLRRRSGQRAAEVV